MQENDFFKISRPPKRNYCELLGNSSDFGSWEGYEDVSVYLDYKKKKKRKRKKLMEAINSYEF